MKKKTILIGALISLLFLSACSQINQESKVNAEETSVVNADINLKDEANVYVKWMLEEQEKMTSATSKWSELQESYKNEELSLEELKKGVESDLLPITEKLMKDAEDKSLSTEEIKNVHAFYLDVLKEQHKGFKEFAESGKKVDSISSETISNFTTNKSLYIVEFIELMQKYGLNK